MVQGSWLLPFHPLPENFLQLLSRLEKLPQARIVDLGAGDGEFGRLLGQHGLQVVELDCSSLAAGGSISLRADALQPPLLPGCLDCLLAGNLWRHLLVQDKAGDFLDCWLRLLKPGGTLFIFEDEPSADDLSVFDPAERNFRDLQSFLADLMPHNRGPLVSRDFFLNWANGLAPEQDWQSGIRTNNEKPSAHAVCRMLQANGTNPNPGGEAGKLLAAIKKHGLSYGSYWWASAQID